MFKNLSKYWWCQIIGWSINIAISVFFVITFGKSSPLYFTSLICTCLVGLIVTHIMRMNIHSLKVLDKPIQQQVFYFIVLTIVFSILFGVIAESIDFLIGYKPERLQKYSKAERLFLSSFNALWLILIWNLSYYIYHYVERNRKQELDTFRLEAMVKSLELKTIKSHINPHFIFNALNSIRALVDENPERARTAITELSNILRSSLRAEQQETVPLQQELDIVRDYLALEHMRFEERLQIEMDIDPDTLTQSVPPMMLQTLVENAIKHGISKKIDGGFIRIASIYKDNHHELVVQNSGTLNGNGHSVEGFGIKSTQDRLNLLYQGKALFEIQDIKQSGMVQSRIIMPVAAIL
ncbi:MAG: sensor histidine kinase [Ferruginibacter sp.]|nr:sensor histidine kinase [Ferruginibacter sp.]